MNTKSALIIAVAIVIGFSIEPILDRVDFSDPKDRLVKVISGENFAVTTYVKAGDVDWYWEEVWYCDAGIAGDEYAVQTIIDMGVEP